jgi:hypothetical protein
MLEDNELQLDDIVRMNPVFRCLANEVLLLSTGGRVTLDRVAARTDDVVEL